MPTSGALTLGLGRNQGLKNLEEDAIEAVRQSILGDVAIQRDYPKLIQQLNRVGSRIMGMRVTNRLAVNHLAGWGENRLRTALDIQDEGRRQRLFELIDLHLMPAAAL